MLMAKDISKVLQGKVSECGYLIRFPWPYDWCYKSPKYTPPGAPKKVSGKFDTSNNWVHNLMLSIHNCVFTFRHPIYHILNKSMAYDGIT